MGTIITPLKMTGSGRPNIFREPQNLSGGGPATHNQQEARDKGKGRATSPFIVDLPDIEFDLEEELKKEQAEQEIEELNRRIHEAGTEMEETYKRAQEAQKSQDSQRSTEDLGRGKRKLAWILQEDANMKKLIARHTLKQPEPHRGSPSGPSRVNLRRDDDQEDRGDDPQDPEDPKNHKIRMMEIQTIAAQTAAQMTTTQGEGHLRILGQTKEEGLIIQDLKAKTPTYLDHPTTMDPGPA